MRDRREDWRGIPLKMTQGDIVAGIATTIVVVVMILFAAVIA